MVLHVLNEWISKRKLSVPSSQFSIDKNQQQETVNQ